MRCQWCGKTVKREESYSQGEFEFMENNDRKEDDDGVTLTADELNGLLPVSESAPPIAKLMPWSNFILGELVKTLFDEKLESKEKIMKSYDHLAAFATLAYFYGKTGKIPARPDDNNKHKEEGPCVCKSCLEQTRA